MLNRDADSPTTREELIPNFRVFTLGEDGSPAYGSPLTNRGDGASQFVYCIFVSVISELFNYKPSLDHMIRETQAANGSSNFPILIAIGDTLYDITKEYLFNFRGKKDPVVEKARKCKEKCDEIAGPAGLGLNYESIAWKTFVEADEYADFKKFTDAIVNRDLTSESLQQAFQGKDTASLFFDIEQQCIRQNLAAIANDYTKKSIPMLEAAVLSETRTLEHAWEARERTKKPGEMTTLKASGDNTGEVALTLDQRKDGLNKATYPFLANEYATFLLLASLTNIKEVLHLQSSEDLSSSMLAFCYPITSTPGAELIFATFLKINQLYCKHSDSLGLSPTNLATFVDSLVPKEFTRHHAKEHNAKKSSDQSDESLGNNDSTSSNSSDDGKSPPQEQQYIYRHRRATSPTLFKDEVEVFLEMVTKTLDRKGLTKDTVSSPRVSCEIIRGEKNAHVVDSVLLDDVLDSIRDATKNALKDFSRTLDFNYKGYPFQLTVEPINKAKLQQNNKFK